MTDIETQKRFRQQIEKVLKFTCSPTYRLPAIHVLYCNTGTKTDPLLEIVDGVRMNDDRPFLRNNLEEYVRDPALLLFGEITRGVKGDVRVSSEVQPR